MKDDEEDGKGPDPLKACPAPSAVHSARATKPSFSPAPSATAASVSRRPRKQSTTTLDDFEKIGRTPNGTKARIMKRGVNGEDARDRPQLRENEGKFFWAVFSSVDSRMFRGTLYWSTPERAALDFRRFCKRAHLFEWGVYTPTRHYDHHYSWRVRLKGEWPIIAASSHKYPPARGTDAPKRWSDAFRAAANDMANAQEIVQGYAHLFRQKDNERRAEHAALKHDHDVAQRVRYDKWKAEQDAKPPPTAKQLRRRRRREVRKSTHEWKRLGIPFRQRKGNPLPVRKVRFKYRILLGSALGLRFGCHGRPKEDKTQYR